MNRPDQFWRSIDVLATAYLQGRLKPLDCTSCAVGNLIASELEQGGVSAISVIRWPAHSTSEDGTWPDADCSQSPWYIRKAVSVIDANPETLEEHPGLSPSDSMGSVAAYSIEDFVSEAATVLPYDTVEIFRIEQAFMTESSYVDKEEASLFEGLMNVVGVLCDVHEVEDEDLKAEARASFKGDYNTVDAVLP